MALVRILMRTLRNYCTVKIRRAGTARLVNRRASPAFFLALRGGLQGGQCPPYGYWLRNHGFVSALVALVVRPRDDDFVTLRAALEGEIHHRVLRHGGTEIG